MVRSHQLVSMVALPVSVIGPLTILAGPLLSGQEVVKVDGRTVFTA
jgi:uncharacterized Zn-binding protein involved in type VI secretion